MENIIMQGFLRQEDLVNELLSWSCQEKDIEVISLLANKLNQYEGTLNFKQKVTELHTYTIT